MRRKHVGNMVKALPIKVYTLYTVPCECSRKMNETLIINEFN